MRHQRHPHARAAQPDAWVVRRGRRHLASAANGRASITAPTRVGPSAKMPFSLFGGTSDWPTPYPACPSPIVNSIYGCDFVTAPQRVQDKVSDILARFKHDRAFRGKQHGVTHGLWGMSPAEQTRLRIRLTVLWHTLEHLRPSTSAIVELGTYLGSTAMGMRMVMDHLGYRYPEHVLHVYDSFEGLPAPNRSQDGRTELKAGHLRSSIDTYLDRFRSAVSVAELLVSNSSHLCLIPATISLLYLARRASTRPICTRASSATSHPPSTRSASPLPSTTVRHPPYLVTGRTLACRLPLGSHAQCP